MSQTERQAWSDAPAAVVAPPKGSAAASAALRLTSTVENAAALVGTWDAPCLPAASAQQVDVLTIAAKQGLLFRHQVPTAAPVPLTSSPTDQQSWKLLSKLLVGQYSQLVPVRAVDFSPADAELDDAQRMAVASALATPDVFLIQAAPGSGKSRVIAELATQTTRRGERVLLLSTEPAALNRVLERLTQSESVFAVRCLGPHERLADLPSAIRAMTWEGRAAAVRDRTMMKARDARQAAELQCARRRHEEPLWARLEELLGVLASARAEREATESRIQIVPSEVAREAERPKGRLAEDVRALHHAAESTLSRLASQTAELAAQRDKDSTNLQDAERRLEIIERHYAARLSGRWWTLKWWKAVLKSDLSNQVAIVQVERGHCNTALEKSTGALMAIEDERCRTQENLATNLNARLQQEIDSRQLRLRDVAARQSREEARHEALWSDLCGQIDTEALRPHEQGVSALQAARALWQSQRRDDEARCGFARQWSEFLENSSAVLMDRLPDHMNLVVATYSGLAADPHFGDTSSALGSFDLMIVLGADRPHEGELLKAASRARRWVLIGEPALHAEPRQARPHRTNGEIPPNGPTRRNPFHELWDRLHCDPSSLPYAWFRENHRLGCRLRQVSAEEKKWVESEPLADAPEVTLRILALPHTRPVLAEVLFPGTMSVPAAKEFLYRELQEITVQTSASHLRWQETPDMTIVHFGSSGGAVHTTKLDEGLRECLGGTHSDKTCKLEFDRAAGWDRETVERWLDQHLGLRDLGRTACLEHMHRMLPLLGAIVREWLGLVGHARPLDGIESSEPAVEFVAVVGSAKHQSTRRPAGHASQTSELATAPLPSAGAGLEIDLAGIRSPDRVPIELRGLLPNRGYVNLIEAYTVVRHLERMLNHSKQGNGRSGVGSVAVIALYHAQAELIRNLIKQSPHLAAHTSHIAVGVPSDFAHREADVVLVSLTRSHSHRAVSYGQGPPDWVLALTRARRKIVLLGDPGNLVRRGNWRGALDHLDEAESNREARLVGQLLRYLQGHGHFQRAFRFDEGYVP